MSNTLVIETISTEPSTPTTTEKFKVVKQKQIQSYTSYLGESESFHHKENLILIGVNYDGDKVSRVQLNKASFCCAIAELGSFSFSHNGEQDSQLLKTAIDSAWEWNKGLITATLTNYTDDYYHQMLKRHGFEVTDKFINPNTGKVIFRYSLFRDGVREKVKI